MEQTITSQQRPARWRLLRPFGLICALLLSGSLGLQAQTVSWTTGYPNLSPSTLTALDDPGYLNVYFTPTVANITNAKLEVTFPAGITYVSTENGTGHHASITYSTPTFSAQTVTVTFNSNGNTLRIGEAVSLRLKVNATCSAVNGMDATIKVLSGSTTVTSGQRTVPVGVQKPTIRVQCAAPTQNYTSQTDKKEFELSLDAQNGEAASFLLVLTGDQYATLSDFSFEGTAITPVSSNVISGTTSKTTLKLTTTEMGGKLGTTVKKFKFKAESSRCGARNITTSAQYSATTNCVTHTGVTLTMSFPSEAGLPYMDCVVGSAGYYDAIDGNEITIYQAPKDVTTPTYLKISYKNTGAADAYDMNIPSLGLYSERRALGFIDETNIRYRIDAGTLETIPPNMISGGNKVGNNAASGFAKAEYLDKYVRVNATIPEVVPANSTVTVWVPAYLGIIYDNTGKNAFVDYFSRTDWGIVGNAAAKNRCDVQGAGSVNLYYKQWNYDPFFREVPNPMIVKPNQVVNEQVRMSAAGLSSTSSTYSTAEIFIEMPEWMELNGTAENSIKIKTLDGATTWSGIPGTGTDHGVSSGKRTYSIKFTDIGAVNSNVYLHVDYKTGNCRSTTENQTEEIRYWLNWQVGQPSATNPSLDMSSQVFQDVTMLCKLNGVTLGDFTITRTTIGLKDNDNNSVPDDGTPADPSMINHNYYLLNDKGYLQWNATIVGTPTDAYNHWYAPVSLTTVNLNQIVPQSGSATVSINGGAPLAVSYTKVDNYRFYLHYDATSVPLKGGDQIGVKLLFDIKGTNDQLYNLSTECFVSNPAIADPFNSQGDVNRHGDDVAVQDIGLYSDDNRMIFNKLDPAFPDNNVQTDQYYGYFNYFHRSYPAGYFENEIRRKYYPAKLTVELPEGYMFTNDLNLMYKKLDAPTTVRPSLSPASVSGSTYVYDFASLYDLTYDGSGTPLASGKFMLPDDYWLFEIRVSTRATRGAALGNSVGKWTVVRKEIETGTEVTQSITKNFSYSGLATTLSLSTNTLPAYGSRLNIPVVTVGNPNAINLNNVWLYITGNVSNISITPTGGGASTNGTGFEGRWVKVSDLMAANTTLPYKLDFTYGGSNDCSVTDKIKIYTVSGFDAPWTAPISAALDLTDYDHVGANKELGITAAPATISGNLSISTQILDFNTPYTVTAGLNALSSQGALKDPQMEIVIPKGQKYVNGSAKIEYPLGAAPVPVSSALESALQAINANLGSPNTVTLNAGSFLLPGYLAAGTDNDRQIKIMADFSPQCETVLTGIHYTGKLGGQTACGGVAQGHDATMSTVQLFSNITSNYIFQVGSALSDGNNAFNEKRTTGTFRVTIRKITGPTDDMAASDYLLLTFPKQFDVKGQASISSGLGIGAVTTLSTGIVGDERQVKLSLPVSAYNAAANKGVGVDVVYDIPVVYTPSGQDLALVPKQKLLASVITEAKFGTCPNSPASIGAKELDIAVLTAASNTANACLNTAEELKITSSGFGGSWYGKSDRTGAVLSSTATYNYTPVLQRDTIFYVSAVVDAYDYGTVPVEVKMRPEATITATALTIQCSMSSGVNLTTAVSNTPPLSTVKYYSDNAGVNELSNTTVTPTVTTTYYAQVTTAEGCKSAVTPIVVSVISMPDMTAPANLTVCPGATGAINLAGLSTNTTHFTWSGGASIGLSDEDGATPKTQIPSFTAVNSTATPVTVTITVTPQNTTNGTVCSGTSKTFTVTVRPLSVIQLTTNKTDDEVCMNEDITFTTATGMTNYVWDKGGATTTTSGGGTADNTVTLQWNTAGKKTVSVNYTDNTGCTATTPQTKEITVSPAMAITTQPALASAIKLPNGTILPGSDVALTVVASGHNPTYEWFWKKASDGTVVPLTDNSKYSGTTTATFTIKNAYEEQNGDYYVKVTGACGTATSNPVAVVVVAGMDASLKDLKVNGVSLPDFDAAKTDYVHYSTCEEGQVTILGTPNSNGVTITGNGTFSLNPGDNYFNITVTAQDMVTTMTYTVNVVRNCHVAKITKDLEDAIICINDSYTFEIEVEFEGEGVTYEWYYGNRRIWEANTNRYTITNAQLNDYERYYVIVRSNYNGYRASTYSKQVRLWVAEQLPVTLKYAIYPDSVVTGKTYHLKLEGYSDVTNYRWSYNREGVTFSPETGKVGENETWATFGTLSAGTGTITVTLTHPCGTRELSRTIRVDYPAGAESVTASQVTIYPNPTAGTIRINNTVSNRIIKVTDVAGSLKGSYRTQDGTTTIDLTDYAKGTYMVQYAGRTYKVIRK